VDLSQLCPQRESCSPHSPFLAFLHIVSLCENSIRCLVQGIIPNAFLPAWFFSSSFFVHYSRQGTPPASRQLTIFYGGQAHVFDEVPSDKVRFMKAYLTPEQQCDDHRAVLLMFLYSKLLFFLGVLWMRSYNCVTCSL
jgi:hypothetical protein